MPPRTISTSSAQEQQDQMFALEGIENFELPKALVTRIAKSALPDSAKLQKDTVLGLTRGATVFINYLAATAQDIAHSRSHKTIAATDVLKALELIEMDDMVPELQAALQAYKTNPTKAGNAKGKEKEKKSQPEPTSQSAGPAGSSLITFDAYQYPHADTSPNSRQYNAYANDTYRGEYPSSEHPNQQEPFHFEPALDPEHDFEPAFADESGQYGNGNGGDDGEGDEAFGFDEGEAEAEPEAFDEEEEGDVENDEGALDEAEAEELSRTIDYGDYDEEEEDE